MAGGLYHWIDWPDTELRGFLSRKLNSITRTFKGIELT